MKATLHFKFPEEKEDYDRMIKGPLYLRALQDIHTELFRAPRKYGFKDSRLKERLEACDELKLLVGNELEAVGSALVRELERKFLEILIDHDVEI